MFTSAAHAAAPHHAAMNIAWDRGRPAGATMVLGAGAGAVGGGILGALTWAGITHEEALVYEDLIRRGGTLVMVRADGDERERATAILHRDGAADATTLEEEWRHKGLA